jgi:hypothetical protein
MKKYIAAILCILVLTAAMPVIYAADEDIEITNQTIEPNTTLQMDQHFLLKLEITKKAEVASDSVYLNLNGGDFVFTQGGNSKSYKISHWDTDTTTSISVPMKYTGGKNTIMTLNFNYKIAPDDTVKTTSKNEYISVDAIPQAPATPPPFEVPEAGIDIFKEQHSDHRILTEPFVR